MKQITVISGKGGTGKTTVTGAFASIAKDAVLADCDADAPDLQLILTPKVLEEIDYYGSATATRKTDCSMCGKCREVCRFNAIDEEIRVNEPKCEGCGACVFVCPEDALEMNENKTGTVFVSETRFGPMVHAELEIGEEASGKMVTQVRQKAQELAEERDLIIVDGSPGIGCPVIASIKGVDQVLVVAEPTVSGIHDLRRVLEVTDHFGVKASVCINKFDINEDKSKEIENMSRSLGVPVLGKLPYDDVATEAMINEQTVIEYSDSDLSEKIREIWREVESSLLEG
ncbi:(4Fe-4S)-binding protein [candidate division MSBL1 archaeon SCGC-AAA259D14]|uniref:(4Fe-4S)-binding protein n=3 Tax=candidate division MSBL1 TaxID=215777 RepID=A0A133U877_9EURY|nr:(4Fe-4S)-binding protein [candidate division MSBL1 archaeon SCGC-AAA259B11]KXA90346.1 (4Fe-4S)-binding protein [candidate division MSBL1 archaeon SCGC-AAA259D14]KXA95164.1 (4Fe-4S)-binding protein [candidate division MSBL1 archaeon SCGC-AAA259I07]